MMNGRAYREQALGPLDDAWPCGSIGGDRTSVGTGECASLGEALESLVDGLDTTGPIEVGGLGSMSEGILHTV